MITPIIITLTVLCVAMGLFAWNRIPAAVVALGASLVLYFTGIVTAGEFTGGLGDPVVILIAALLAIAVGLEAAGVSAWAGHLLVRKSGGDPARRMVMIMVAAALFSALVGMNGAVAAMLPVTIVVAIRTQTAPSRLMIPLAFACLTGSKLTLLGTPVNVIAAAQADEMGVGHIGFFEWSVLGIPLLAGTIVITVLFARRLLPERQGQQIPPDLSQHAHTLVEQYRLDDELHLLAVSDASPLIGRARASLELSGHPGLALVAVQQADGARPAAAGPFQAGQMLLLCGERDVVQRCAGDLGLTLLQGDQSATIAAALLNREIGLAEVVIPSRSKLVGQAVFPGMTTDEGGMMVLAVQRAGGGTSQQPTVLQAGDHVLLQGTWQSLDRHAGDPHAIVVDAPDVLQKQAVPLGRGARAAIAILVLLVVMLALDLVPPAVAAVTCATLMVVCGVVRPAQVYRGLDWNTCVLIGAMIPLATAMTKTGTAELLGHQVVEVFGAGGPLAVLAGLFLVTATVSQFISNTSAALVMRPVSLATALEMDVSALPLLMGVAMGLAWWLGLACLAAGGALPVITRYMDHSKDTVRDVGIEFDDRTS